MADNGEDRSMDSIRKEIDDIDQRLIQLLRDRASLAQAIGELKGSDGRPFFTPERERQIYERLRNEDVAPLRSEQVVAIFREVISAARAAEKQMSVSYWGPAGTYSHLAAIETFGRSTAFEPVDTIEDVVRKEGRPTSPDAIDACYRPLAATNFELVDQIYVWNKGHYDWLLQNTPMRPKRVRIVGGFRVDLAKYGSHPDLQRRPAVVGVIGRFTAINPHDGDYGRHMFALSKYELERKVRKYSIEIQLRVALVLIQILLVC